MGKKKNDRTKPGALRVWHIPQVPGKAFRVPVASVDEAKVLLRALAQYDLFSTKTGSSRTTATRKASKSSRMGSGASGVTPRRTTTSATFFDRRSEQCGSESGSLLPSRPC